MGFNKGRAGGSELLGKEFGVLGEEVKLVGPVVVEGEVDAKVADAGARRELIDLVPARLSHDGWGGVPVCVCLIVGFGGVEANVVGVEEAADALRDVDHFFVCVGRDGCVIHEEKS